MDAPRAATVRLLIWAGFVLAIFGMASCMVQEMKAEIANSRQQHAEKLNEALDL